jgi:hypothetical protein
LVALETGKETTFLPAIWTNIQESVNKSNVLVHVSYNQTKARRATGNLLFTHGNQNIFETVLILPLVQPGHHLLALYFSNEFTVTVTFAIRLDVHNAVPTCTEQPPSKPCTYNNRGLYVRYMSITGAKAIC